MPPVQFVFGEERVQTETWPGLNLLAHAQLLERDVGSRCGGHGHCGGDRLRVIQGGASLTPVTEHEREHLSEEALAQGVRLGCQVFPNEALSTIIVVVF